ncbi:sulfate permease, SulP family [Alphaproteobacteria bacterium]
MIAVIEAYRAGLLKFENWKNNIIAGIIVGVVALPLAMAFAIASGVKPAQGIYTAIIAGLIVGIFGGTRTQVSGPTGAFVVILATITAKYGVGGLQFATIMAGLILCGMGVLKLGNAIKFIPYPVIIGFTSGIGVIIFVSQWKDFFGLPISIPIDASFYQKFIILINAFPQIDFRTTTLSLVSLIILVVTPKYIKNVPSPLIAMLFATFIQYSFNFTSIATIGSVFGKIPQSLPKFTFPDFSHLTLVNLIGSAFTIALLGAIESLLSAAVADSISGTKHNANQELIGQGLANIVAPFFGGFASTGAIARTVTNIRHGGNGPISAIVHSVVLVLILLILAPYAVHIPFSALSAILFIVAFNMSDIPEFVHIMRRAPWYDVFVLVMTFFLTIFVDLVVAVTIGVITAMLFFVVRIHQSVKIDKHSFKDIEGGVTTQRVDATFLSDGIIYVIEGPFFFGVAEKIEHALAVTHTDPKFIVFRLLYVPFIDMTGLETLSKIIDQYHKRGVRVYICEANRKVLQKITRIGILEKIQNNAIFGSLEEIREFLEHG